MSKSIREIKSESRQLVNNRFGEAFIIAFVPFFLMNAFLIFLGQIFRYFPNKVEFVFDFVSQLLLTVFATYLSLKLLIQFIRSKELSFDRFFQIDERFFTFILLRILSLGVIILLSLPIIPVYAEMFETIQYMVDPVSVENYLLHSDIIPRLIEAYKITAFLFFLFWIVTVRFQMIPYIIVDRNTSLIESIRLSWEITKGNYFKILLFPFTYFLWLLLIFTFIGIFYVVPLILVGYGTLYTSMMEEYERDEDYY